jgi:hypothetical protein
VRRVPYLPILSYPVLSADLGGYDSHAAYHLHSKSSDSWCVTWLAVVGNASSYCCRSAAINLLDLLVMVGDG